MKLLEKRRERKRQEAIDRLEELLIVQLKHQGAKVGVAYHVNDLMDWLRRV
jgi:hypothetical protein